MISALFILNFSSIVKGNVWANGSGDAGPSEGALSTLCDSEEEDGGAGVTPPSTDDELYQSKATGEGEDCCRGSRLFISFMAKLVSGHTNPLRQIVYPVLSIGLF